MNIEYKDIGRNELGLLYSVEFPQASATCEMSFWFVFNGGNSPISASLIIDDEVEAIVFFLSTTGSFTTWQYGNFTIGK